MPARATVRASLLSLLPLLLLAAPESARAGNGDPTSGQPNWQERSVLMLVNACRQGPEQYRDAYLTSDPGILLPANYPAQPPLYFSLPLNQAARFHSVDMATNNCFQHNSCDGTPTFTRIASFYSEGATGENIAAGYPTPFAVVNAWLSDSHAADKSGLDGHRANIMYSISRETGVGWVYSPSSSYGQYWTQDFGLGAVDYVTPLAWGSHVFTGDGNTTFMANYYSATNQAPQAALVFVDGVPYTMLLRFGTPARGTYSLALPTAAGCRTYYFRFLDATGVYRLFPEGGKLRTTQEGGCAEDYLAGAVEVTPVNGEAFALAAPAPNPATSRTLVRFTLPEAADVTLRVLDVGGRLVRCARVRASAGAQEWAWDTRDDLGRPVASGVYFVRLEANAARADRRVVVMRAR